MCFGPKNRSGLVVVGRSRLPKRVVEAEVEAAREPDDRRPLLTPDRRHEGAISTERRRVRDVLEDAGRRLGGEHHMASALAAVGALIAAELDEG